MNNTQQAKFDLLYEKHVSALKRQGKSEKTVEAYSRAVRRIAETMAKVKTARVCLGHGLRCKIP
jgi:hypothetical protein